MKKRTLLALLSMVGALAILLMAAFLGNEEDSNAEMAIKKIDGIMRKAEIPQKKLTKAEKTEGDYYHDLIKMNPDQNKEIHFLIRKMNDSLLERKVAISQEKEIVDKAKREREKYTVKKISNQSSEKDMKEKNVFDRMDRRFSIHEQLIQAYKKSVKADKHLYTLFNSSKTSITELQNAIETVNDQYKKVKRLNEEYNSESLGYIRARNAFFDAGT
ncbi:YkyA family protein [Bacillus sp. 1P06AnD]|uniref:YkyA family protein n=1 Tax=Bacillus sp. 1P06AnD TaxID=3132208 RepID=UPI0039A1566A